MWKRYNFSTHLEDPGIYMCYEKISPHSSHTISSQIPSLVYNSDGTSLINSQLHCVHCFFKSPHFTVPFLSRLKQPNNIRYKRRAQMPFTGPKIEVLWSPPEIMNLQLGAQKINPTPSHVVPLCSSTQPKGPEDSNLKIPSDFWHKFQPTTAFFVTVQLFALFFPS